MVRAQVSRRPQIPRKTPGIESGTMTFFNHICIGGICSSGSKSWVLLKCMNANQASGTYHHRPSVRTHRSVTFSLLFHSFTPGSGLAI